MKRMKDAVNKLPDLGLKKQDRAEDEEENEKRVHQRTNEKDNE